MASPWHSLGSTEQVDLMQLEVKEILTLILLELRKINIHLQIVNDEEEVE